MSSDITVLGLLGPLSVIYLFYILAKLSERLGSVEKMPSIYRYYYVAIGFIVIGFITQLFVARAMLSLEGFPRWLTSPWFILLAHYLPLAIGVTIGVIITWRYWSWLITEYIS